MNAVNETQLVPAGPVGDDRFAYRADEFLAQLGYLQGKPTFGSP